MAIRIEIGERVESDEVRALLNSLPEDESVLRTLPAGTLVSVQDGFGIPLSLVNDTVVRTTAKNWVIDVATRKEVQRKRKAAR